MAQNKWISLLTDAARAVLRALGDSSRGGGGTGTSGTGTGAAGKGAGAAGKSAGARPSRAPKPGPSGPGGRRSATTATAPGTGSYPGDFTGRVRAEYSPQPDGDPDPGEIVWTWVPFEEDFTQGKDRPVLLVGRDGGWLLAIMCSSKDHSRDASDEARWGRRWLDIGSGPWDAQGRASEVRLDRVLRVDPGAVRREGAVVDRATFEKIVRAMDRR